MEARELRTFNIIEQGVVTGIVNTTVFVNGNALLQDELSGEPISEGLLKGFGFTEIPHKFFKNGNFQLGYITTDEYLQFEPYDGRLVDVKYVHQLQNLYFTLTGTELTLNP